MAHSDKFEFNGLGYIVTDAENSQVYVYECVQAVSTNTLIIPQTVQYAGIEYTVVGIGPYAFYDQNITKVSIPDTVKAIGAYAFMNTSLSSVYLPESVETIGKYAFGIDYEGKTVDVDNAEITLDEIKTNTVTNYYFTDIVGNKVKVHKIEDGVGLFLVLNQGYSEISEEETYSVAYTYVYDAENNEDVYYDVYIDEEGNYYRDEENYTYYNSEDVNYESWYAYYYVDDEGDEWSCVVFQDEKGYYIEDNDDTIRRKIYVTEPEMVLEDGYYVYEDVVEPHLVYEINGEYFYSQTDKEYIDASDVLYDYYYKNVDGENKELLYDSVNGYYYLENDQRNYVSGTNIYKTGFQYVLEEEIDTMEVQVVKNQNGQFGYDDNDQFIIVDQTKVEHEAADETHGEYYYILEEFTAYKPARVLYDAETRKKYTEVINLHLIEDTSEIYIDDADGETTINIAETTKTYVSYDTDMEQYYTVESKPVPVETQNVLEDYYEASSDDQVYLKNEKFYIKNDELSEEIVILQSPMKCRRRTK